MTASLGKLVSVPSAGGLVKERYGKVTWQGRRGGPETVMGEEARPPP